MSDVERPSDLGIVILSYGAGPVVRVVEHLVNTGVAPSTIVVVHNPSEDQAIAPAIPFETHVINRASNDGYGPGMNEGIRYQRLAGRSLIALVTHDAFIDGTDLLALRDALTSDPSIGLIAPAMRDSISGALLSGGGTIGRTARVRHLADDAIHGVTEVDWVDGAALVMRAHGPLVPEPYFLYFEDVALAWQVRRRGGRVCSDSDRFVRTTPAAATKRELFRYLSWRNRLAFARTELGAFAAAGAAAELAATAAVRSLQALRGFAPRTAWALAQLYLAALTHGLRLQLGPVSSRVTSLTRSIDGPPR